MGRVYGKRNIVESVFSTMKRRFGDETWSRKEELKFKEMLLVVVAYNAWKFYFWEVFYSALALNNCYLYILKYGIINMEKPLTKEAVRRIVRREMRKFLDSLIPYVSESE